MAIETGDMRVIFQLTVLFLSVAEVAVSVTVAGLGTLVGAV